MSPSASIRRRKHNNWRPFSKAEPIRMNNDSSPLNVVMFSGGRGTGSITEAFLKHGQISLTLLVNTYDDGLSTGALRALIPGMLGPSDVRKNVSRLIPENDRADRALRYFMEY